MDLKQIRKFEGDKYTISDFYINEAKICNIMEDPVRVLIDKNKDGDFDDSGEGKIYGETAIPAGRYEVVITYSNRFRKYLPLLLNVPGYSGIRIHPGNSAVDTHGCLLPGVNDITGKVTQSTKYFTLIFDKISNALNVKKEKVFIEII
jgi:hypothetical protein